MFQSEELLQILPLRQWVVLPSRHEISSHLACKMGGKAKNGKQIEKLLLEMGGEPNPVIQLRTRKLKSKSLIYGVKRLR